MELLHVVTLAVIQGITEFLPISSSAHLILPKELLGWPDQGLGFDVAVHVGSLLAVLTYFRKDILNLSFAWCRSCIERKNTDDSRLAWFIIIATIPAGLAGLVFNDFIESYLRGKEVIMMTTIVFGLYLWWTDRSGSKQLNLTQLTLWMVLTIGFAQALALIPGTSRSGITMAAALAVGMQRESAAKISFLLSIPIIVLSGGYQGLELMQQMDTPWKDILIGVVLSAISAFICIHFFLHFIQKIGMLPFVIYRLLLGLGIGILLLV